MQFMEPQLCSVVVDEGLLLQANGHYKKLFTDLRGLYADEDAFEVILAKHADDIAYEVTSFHPGKTPIGCSEGAMIFGVTRMEPGRVGDEFFLTRGHIHAKADRPEVYYGQKGHGLMLMESPQGDIRICEIGPQSICYVPPFWIHRSVNTGDEDLVMMFSYPADAGQDYAIIEQSGGMRSRIVSDGDGGWKQIENPNYKPRTAEDIERIVRPHHAKTEPAA